MNRGRHMRISTKRWIKLRFWGIRPKPKCSEPHNTDLNQYWYDGKAKVNPIIGICPVCGFIKRIGEIIHDNYSINWKKS